MSHRSKKKREKPVSRSRAKVGDLRYISSNGKSKAYWTSSQLKKSKSSRSSRSSSRRTTTKKTTTPKKIDYKYYPNKETSAQYNARIAKARGESTPVVTKKTPASFTIEELNRATVNGDVEAFKRMGVKLTKEQILSLKQNVSVSDSQSSDVTGNDNADTGKDYSDEEFKKTAEFRALSKQDQEAVLDVFGAIATNDKKQAARLADAFAAASKISDPYFAQQLRLAVDSIERGYVSIDKEALFQEEQTRKRLVDFKEDFARKKEFMSLEQIDVMKNIERRFDADLETLQQGLAVSGFSSSSRSQKKTSLLTEATGDLRESKRRSFEFQLQSDQINLDRNERDVQSELARLARLTEKRKLDFLRSGEQKVGTKNLPSIPGVPDPLGDIYGQIPQNRLQDTLNTAKSFVF